MKGRKLFPIVAVVFVMASCSGYDITGVQRVRERGPERDEPKSQTGGLQEFPPSPINKCAIYHTCAEK